MAGNQQALSANFNSIKVRLKHDQPLSAYDSVLFQFHKGTIKTHLPHKSIVLFRHFNSIKVRLKHCSGLPTGRAVLISIP